MIFVNQNEKITENCLAFLKIEISFCFLWMRLGALLPSHGLPPFGANITNIAMGEGLCGSSMFGGDRWSVGVNPMTAGK